MDSVRIAGNETKTFSPFPIRIKIRSTPLDSFRGHVKVTLGQIRSITFRQGQTVKSEFLNDDPKIKIIYLSGPFSRSASVDLGIKSAGEGPLLVTDVDMVFNKGGFSNKLFQLFHWPSIVRSD